MGVYINTEMPKEGTVFVIDSAGQVWSNEWPTRGYIRLDGVTAVPIPPHGRLIDGTDLYAVLDGGFDVDLDELPETKDALLSMIQSAETIIPAEEGET